jgi:predicted nucleic acid-binding protein
LSERLFVDTSAWFAFVNRRDPDHAPTRRLLEEHGGALVTSNYVFDETVTLCLLRLGHAAAVRVGAALQDPDVVHLVRASAEDERHAWGLFRDRLDKRYSYTDCTSFILMRRLDLTRAAALDDDFRREGFDALP